jgi:hypothetical protein
MRTLFRLFAVFTRRILLMLLAVLIATIVFSPGSLLAAEPGPAKALDFATIIGYLAPLIVILLTQVLKIWIQSRFAPVVVLVLGGLAMLLNVGPAPGTEFIDNTVNVGYVSGVATLIYDLIKKLKTKPAA